MGLYWTTVSFWATTVFICWCSWWAIGTSDTIVEGVGASGYCSITYCIQLKIPGTWLAGVWEGVWDTTE